MKTLLTLTAIALTLAACSKEETAASASAPTPAMPTGPANSALRVACDADATGAEITVNGQFKGECPLDIQVPAGSFKLVVRKKVGDDKERRFEQDVNIGDGVAKKVEVELSAAKLTGEALAKLKAQGIEPGKVFRDCPDCPEMVVLPPGEFMMGSPVNEKDRSESEGPQHKVSIAYALSVGKYEVTFAEWDTCVAAGGCTHKPSDEGWGRGRQPVINVSWDDAQQYVKWLSQKTGKTYRLLSEAEWEYACRAGGHFTYCGSNTLSDVAWYADNSNGRSHTVGAPANAFGLHDMSGNVREWVQDCWHGNYTGAPADGSAWTSGKCDDRRGLRGGSWYFRAGGARAAFRDSLSPDYRAAFFGFRLARTN